MQNQESIKDFIDQLKDEHLLACHVVAAAPGGVPTACFPDVIAAVLEHVTAQEWNELNERAKNYLKWFTIKAESIDILSPKMPQITPRGFELLANDREGTNFGIIVERCQEMGIPSVLVRFASLIATFLTVRLLQQHMQRDGEVMPTMNFSQNVDVNYLNYPRALKTILELFPEYREMFYFEINEQVTEDYLTTIRTLAEDLGIRLALDDTNKMDDRVHHQLLDLADWIKIDFQATAYLESQLLKGSGEEILGHFEQYARGAKSPVIVFEGLGEASPLKNFLEKRWQLTNTQLYYQSRERPPVPPWSQYFGLIQDYHADKFGLFFKGLIIEK